MGSFSGGARIVVQSGGEGGHAAELNGMSVGYGLHQAWIFSVLFGTAGVFGVPLGADGLSSSPVFGISIVTNALCLLALGLFDQKLLRFLVDRRCALAAAALMVVGTLLILGCGTQGTLQAVLCVAAGVLTGVGSAVLVVFWGTAFARMNFLSIALNTAAASVISVLVYALALHAFSAPASGVLAALLPLAEVFFLWNHTPIPYSERRVLPIFNPLPINHLRFAAMISVPMLLFGLPLGYMRERCTVFALPAAGMSWQAPLLVAAAGAALVVMLAGFASADDERVDFIARVLVPLVAASMFCVPLTYNPAGTIAETIVMGGFMCFEALIWVLMGCYAQRYRISPVLIFGAGRGSFALGALLGIAVLPTVAGTGMQEFYGYAATPFALTVCLVLAFAVLPHRRDIRTLVILPEAHTANGADAAKGGDTTAEDDATSEEAARAAAEAPTERKPAAPAPQEPQPEPADDRPLSRAQLAAEHRRQTAAAALDADPAPAGPTLFRMKCERVANRYLLSARESEVLFYLARGFNAAALQEKLFISEGTAKTHIRHIYNKTNVHNQQELMRLVNDEWIEA